MSKIKEYQEEQLEMDLPESKPKMIITIGIPASGKSTWARKQTEYLGANISERDEIRKMVHCDGDLNNYTYTKAREKAVTDIQEDHIKTAAYYNQDIIIADTNLNPNTRNRLEQLGTNLGFEIIYKVFDTPLHECVKRNLKRPHTVPESVLIRMDRELRKYLDKPVYEPQKGLPSCVIYDLDGSLADMKGVRGPFEWDKVLLDNPRKNIVRLAQQWANNYKGEIFIFTGRDGSCLEDSKKWLKAHNVPYNHIYIRPTGNTENDSIIKERMYVEHIHGKYNVDFVLDDRDQVTRMWSSIGLDVLNVGNWVSDF